MGAERSGALCSVTDLRLEALTLGGSTRLESP